MLTAMLLPGLFAATAADRASEILERLAAGFRAMKSYEVRFEIEAEEFTAAGRYTVDGEAYCLEVDDAEVFSDGKVRYEVDNRRREVTVVEVDRESRNLLNNPVRAFDFLGSQYAATLLSDEGGRALVRLTPSDGEASATGTVVVTVSTSTMRPERLEYDYDGERVTVRILGVAAPEAPLRRFDRKNFDGYEMIDFR